MGNRADRLGVAQADDEPAVSQLEETAPGLYRGMRGLIEQSTHLAVTVRGAVTVVDAGALFVPRTCADPGRQALGRRKRPRGGADFRDDLLRRIDTETWNGRESLHSILMRAEQRGEFLIELLHVRLNNLQLCEGHRQQPAVE